MRAGYLHVRVEALESREGVQDRRLHAKRQTARQAREHRVGLEGDQELAKCSVTYLEGNQHIENGCYSKVARGDLGGEGRLIAQELLKVLELRGYRLGEGLVHCLLTRGNIVRLPLTKAKSSVER
jgi:hypothetical protein